MKTNKKILAAVAALALSTSVFSASNVSINCNKEYPHPGYEELCEAINAGFKIANECAIFDSTEIFNPQKRAFPQFSSNLETGYQFVKEIKCAISGNNALLTEENNPVGSVNNGNTDDGAFTIEIILNTVTGQFMSGMKLLLVPLSDINQQTLVLDPTINGVYVVPTNAIAWGLNAKHDYCLAFTEDVTSTKPHLVRIGTGTDAFNDFGATLGMSMCGTDN